MEDKRINKKRITILAGIVLVLVIAGVLAYAYLAPKTIAGVLAYAYLAPKTIEGDWELIVNPETAGATPDEAATDGGKAYYNSANPVSTATAPIRPITTAASKRAPINCRKKTAKR